MSESAKGNPESIHRFSIVRGLLYTFLFGAIGVAIPVLVQLSYITYRSRHLETYPGFLFDELQIQSDEIGLGALGVTSILSALAMSSFSFKPTLNLRRNFCVIVGSTQMSVWIYNAIHGPRYRGMPSFGEALSDLLVLTLPAYSVGLLLMIYQLQRRNHLSQT